MNAAEWWGTLDQCGFTVMRTLLSVLWQSSIVFGAMGLLVWMLRGRRATVRHTLWVAALLMAPVLPLLTSLASRTGAPQAQVPVFPSYTVPVEASAVWMEQVGPLPEFDPAAAPGVTEPEASAGESPRASVLEYPWALLLVAYVAGVVFFLAWTALGRIRLRQWVVGAAPVLDERVRSAFAEAKERLGLRREFLTLESLQVPAPLTAGFLRPVVLLPKGLSDRLTDAELRAVALHESAHIRRRDPLILSLIPLVRAVFFFHPLVWLACRQVSLLAEQAADDAVLDATGKPIAYAKMLARLAEDLRRASFTTELAVGILLSKGAFLRRVEAILSDRRDQIRKLSRWALVCTVLAALISLALAAALPLGERQSASPETDADINLEDIFERIRQRQARVKTVRYTWTSKKVVPKGSMPVLDPATGGLPVPSELPLKDTETKTVYTVVIDGQKLRSDEEGLVWFEGEGTGKFVPMGDTLVFGADGVERNLYRFSNGSTGGLIGPLRHATARVWYQAMLQAYRLLDPVLGSIKPKEVRLVGRVEHRGHPCIVIEKRVQLQDSSSVHRWWLAEDMDYCVLRWEIRRGPGEVLARVDMEHEPDEQIGWRLKSWSLTTWTGARGEPITATNVPTEIRLNEPIDPKAFEITFPPGIRVGDQLRGVVYVVGDESETYPAEPVEDDMSFEERVLRVKLKSRRLSFYFTDAPLGDVLDFVRVAAPINIVVDQRVLAERDDLRVTLSLRQGQAELAEALDIISDALGLTWTIRDGSVHISPKAKPTPTAAIGEPASDLVLEEGGQTAPTPAEADEVVQAVVRAMRPAESMRVRWRHKTITPTGGISASPGDDLPESLPYSMREYTATISGERSRIERRDEMYHNREDREPYAVRKSTAVFDGTRYRRLELLPEGSVYPVRGVERPDDTNGQVLSGALFGSVHPFANAERTMRLYSFSLEPSEEPGVYVLMASWPRDGWVERYRLTVDGNRGFNVVKAESLRPDGSKYYEINVKLQKLADGTWFPSGHERIDWSSSTGNTYVGYRVTVTDVELGVEVPDETFQLEFPPGTWVWDHERKERYTVPEEAQKPADAAEAGKRAPELGLEEGAGVTLAQFRGKPVVLAFVSIYSKPCVKVLDELRALQEERGAEKLAVIAIHDRTATREEIEQFRTHHSISFPIVRVPEAARDGWDSETFRAYGVTALPTVALIDGEGKVASIGDASEIAESLSGLMPKASSSTPSGRSSSGPKHIAEIKPPFTFRIRTVTPEGQAQPGVKIRCLHPIPQRGEVLVDTVVSSDAEGVALFRVTRADLVAWRFFSFFLADDGFVGTPLAEISPLDNEYVATFKVLPAVDFELRIVNAGGKPVPNAKVWLRPDYPRYPIWDGDAFVTDAYGHSNSEGTASVRFANVKANLVASAEGYAPTFIRGAELSSETPIEVTMDLGFKITGKVTDSRGGPLAGVRITATLTDFPLTNSERFILRGTTDTEGTFALLNASHGTYEIQADIEDPVKPVLIQPLTWRVSEDASSRQIGLQAEPAAILKGRYFTNHETLAIADRWIRVTTYSRTPTGLQLDPLLEFRTKDDGSFVVRIPENKKGFIDFVGVSGFYPLVKVPKQYTFLRLERPGYVPFNNVPAGVYDDITVQLVLMGIARGTVKEPSGEPCPNLWVSVRPNGHLHKTDSSGRYSAEIPPDQEAWLEVFPARDHQEELVVLVPPIPEPLFRSEPFSVREGEIVERDIVVNRNSPPAAKTEGPPRIVSTAPPAGATDVDPHLSEISVTFDRDMARGFSWTGGGQVYPEVTDRPQWVDNRTCVLPVKLEEGRYYRVGINSKSHRNFKAAYGTPALPTAIYFCTKGSSDQTKQKVQVPEVVRLVPANGTKDVSPETKEIQVTFSVPMGGGFSWTGGGVNYPKGAGNPYWSDDGKTCTRPVRLRPGWNYRLGLNSPSHNNFQSRWGVPLPRVVWTFSTSGQRPRQGETTERSREPASKAPPAVPAWVSPHSPARDSMYALEFDGVSGFVEVPDSATLDLTELTLEAWIKFEVGGDNNPRIVSKGWEVRTGYELAVYGTGEERRLAFLAKGLGRTYSSALLRAGEWYHVAATFDGSTVSLYVNGEPDTSRSVTGGVTPVSIPTNDVALNIARNSQTSRDMFKGAIDEVRIWNVARSPEAIRRDLSRPLTGNEPGLVAYWRFEEGEGDTVHDSTPNQNNGRLLKSSVPEKASSPSDDGPLEASDRDYLIGWFKMREGDTVIPDTVIPVFKTDGRYYSVLRGFEVPFRTCPEGLEWALTPSSMLGTTIGFDEASSAYYIAVFDSQLSNFSDGRGGIGERKPLTRTDKPSGLLDPTAPAPRTNDDFLGWYQPVWFPWWRWELRKEGERYLLVEEELDGDWASLLVQAPKGAPVWKSSGEPSERTPLPEGLGFALGPGGNYSLIYNEALKRFEMTRPKSPGIRMPLARVPAPPSPEGGAVPGLRAQIGIPSWH